MDEKAKIEVLEDCELDGIKFSAGDKLQVMFNPTSYSLQHSANYKKFHTAKKKKALAAYKGPTPSSITLELLFDSEYYRTADDKQTINVLGYVQPIIALTRADETLGRPPYVRFSWGGDDGIRFSGMMETVAEKHEMFDSQGISTRCTLTINIAALSDIASLQREDLSTKIVFSSASDSIKDMNQRLEKMSKTEERRAKLESVQSNKDVGSILDDLNK